MFLHDEYVSGVSGRVQVCAGAPLILHTVYLYMYADILIYIYAYDYIYRRPSVYT